MTKWKPPRPLSIAVTDINQYVMGHKRGWEEAQRRIAELEDNNRALILQAESHITWVRIKTEAFERLIHQLKEQSDHESRRQ